jgi:hypothetical protein
MHAVLRTRTHQINCNPRLGVDSVEVVTAEMVRDGRFIGTQFTPPDTKICKCMEEYRPHVHYTDLVDLAAKSVAVGEGGRREGAGAIGAGGRERETGRERGSGRATRGVDLVCSSRGCDCG